MPDEPQFHRVAAVGDIPPQAGKTVWVNGRALALFNIAGKFYALDDVCPHRGASLGAGFVDGARVLCPAHLFDFDLATGRCSAVNGMLVATYEVRMEDEHIFVRV